MNRIEIVNRLLTERRYQDRRWGTIVEHPHELLGWYAILEMELGHLRNSLDATNHSQALSELVHVASVAMAALEQHVKKMVCPGCGRESITRTSEYPDFDMDCRYCGTFFSSRDIKMVPEEVGRDSVPR